jgi:hypothetical protein
MNAIPLNQHRRTTMPLGLIVIAIFSLLVFGRARDAGRNPYGWTMLLWIGTYLAGVVGGFVGIVASQFVREEFAIPLSALLGMIVGAAVVFSRAGRPKSSTSETQLPNSTQSWNS